MKYTLLLCFVFAGIAAQAQSSTIRLEKKWSTDTTIRTPESVLYDPQQHFLYVSNINGDGNAKDGNGFIARVGTNGQIIKLHWVDGLDAPKGLGRYKNELYAADLDQLVIIDIKAAKVKKKIKLPGATFLNDITVDGNGNVYVSDTRQNKVYRYFNGKAEVYIDDPRMKGVNGLLVWHRQLWILAAGGIYNYDFANKKITLFSDQVQGGDGLSAVNDHDLIASRWVGEVYYVKADGTAVKLLDTKDQHKNTADIEYLPDQRLLVIPTFNGNSVEAYELHH